MHFGKKVSETLSKALQHLIAAKNIDIYIVPPDVTVELSFINTNDQSTLSLYKAAVADENQAGLYAPQHTKTGFGITTGICVLILVKSLEKTYFRKLVSYSFYILNIY